MAGIQPSTPQYFFWMKFLEDESNLRDEFQWRIEKDKGFINWDFLPEMGFIERKHKSQQYRKALLYVQSTIEALRMDCPHASTIYLTEKIKSLKYLRELTEQILTKRKRDIDTHDTFTNKIKESFSRKKPTKSHKEVYELWLKIQNTLDRTVQDFIDEMQERRNTERQRLERQSATSRLIENYGNDNDDNEDENCCTCTLL